MRMPRGGCGAGAAGGCWGGRMLEPAGPERERRGRAGSTGSCPRGGSRPFAMRQRGRAAGGGSAGTARLPLRLPRPQLRRAGEPRGGCGVNYLSTGVALQRDRPARDTSPGRAEATGECVQAVTRVPWRCALLRALPRSNPLLPSTQQCPFLPRSAQLAGVLLMR